MGNLQIGVNKFVGKVLIINYVMQKLAICVVSIIIDVSAVTYAMVSSYQLSCQNCTPIK